MTVIIDRIEGTVAVAELPDGSFAELPLCLVPQAREGDAVTIRIDPEATEARRRRIAGLMGQIFPPRPGEAQK